MSDYNTKAPTRPQMTELLNLLLKLPGGREKLAAWLGRRALIDLTLTLEASGEVGTGLGLDLSAQVIEDELLAKRLEAAALQAQVWASTWGPSPDLDYLAQAACHAARLAKNGDMLDVDAWMSAHAKATDILQGPGCGEEWLRYEVFSGLWPDALGWLK